MKIPKKIKIGGHWWNVKHPYSFTERYDRFAQCDETRKIIMVSGTDGNGNPRAESSVKVSFIHEVLHAIHYLMGRQLFPEDKEESIIEALSEVIYQIIVDNKWGTDEEKKKIEVPVESSQMGSNSRRSWP